MRRVLLTGAGGMLGVDTAAALRRHDVTALTRRDLDVTDADAVDGAVRGHDVVVNCAAWTAVDDAESREGDAFAVNATGAGLLARACARHGCWLLQVSTDYVFDGLADHPYPEDAAPAPRTAYGRTKAAGEWAVRAELPERHWILRTAWLYGAHGANFVTTMSRLEAERATVDVVADQHGQPTWTRDLAARMAEVIDTRPPAGTYHATNAGDTTWYELAREVFGLLGADKGRVRPASSESYTRPAARPAYSVLGHDGWARAGLPPMRAWQGALQEAWREGFPAAAAHRV